MLRAQTEAKKVDVAAQKVAVAAKKVAVAEIREENRVLLTNLNDVADPNLREFIRSEQKRIVQKRSDELAKQSQSTSTPEHKDQLQTCGVTNVNQFHRSDFPAWFHTKQVGMKTKTTEVQSKLANVTLVDANKNQTLRQEISKLLVK
ncbi:protein of unknown function-containing protein [Forsythia ovata]|uniref:Uncharacterized protein n=1 Tax=Forsythia ovata TaxID=205694 RepID=A0ABD1S7G2_9LAMI